MASKKIWLGMLVMVLVFGMAVVGCDLEDYNNPFVGTWVGSDGTAYFEKSSWTIDVYMGGVGLKGTYTCNGNTATITYTQISNDRGVTWRPITSSEASNYVKTATVSGNKLTWGGSTYTRR
ncbi:hypothetical protein FACS1894172_19370 [Spirochaetia bacterium]|nr:hypothetical protein FACS1894172_19370 [Spirochaetia bacterium]